MRPDSATSNPCGAEDRAGESGLELSRSLAPGVPGGATFAATAGEAVAAGDGADGSGCDCCHSVAAGWSNAIGPGGSRCVDDAYSNTVVLVRSPGVTGSPLIGGEVSIATVPVGPTCGIATVPVGPTRGIAIVPVGPTCGIAIVPVGPTCGIAIVPVGLSRGIATVPVGPTCGIVIVPVGPTRDAAALGGVTSGSARMKSSALWKRASGSLASERITTSTRGCGISRKWTVGGSGRSFTWAFKTLYSVLPRGLNGGCPLKSW